MAGRKRHSAEEIVRTLRRGDDLAAAGKTSEEIAAELEVSAATLFNWRRRYGSMDTAAAKELEELREQNGKLMASDDLRHGFAFRRAALRVFAGAVAVSEPDDDGDVKGLVGAAVPTAVKSVPVCLARRGWDGYDTAEMSEGRLRAQSIRVVSDGDEKCRCGVGSESEHTRGPWGDFPDECGEVFLQFVCFPA